MPGTSNIKCPCSCIHIKERKTKTISITISNRKTTGLKKGLNCYSFSLQGQLS